MNVLFLTHSYPRETGDASGAFVLRLARALGEHEGISVRVVAPAAATLASHEDIGGIAVDRFRYAPRRFETLAYGGNMAQQVSGSWSARFTMLGFLGAEFRCAIRIHNAFEPDIVHAHWWFPNGLVGTWLSRLANRPLVTTLHGTDVRLARSVAFSRPAFRHVLQNSTSTTAVSRWLAEAAAGIVSVPSVDVAPMPVATDLFSPAGARGRRLLFVGRLTAQKGLDRLLHALAAMQQTAELDVVGDGEQREGLGDLATALGVGDRVRWHGALPQPDLVAFYRTAAVLVVPSVDEGLGMVAIEAQLCETPVVAFESGGLADVVQHERTGVLVPSQNVGALAGALDDLLSRPNAGVALGAAGRLHALATFAPESVARRYAGIYRSAIASSRKK